MLAPLAEMTMKENELEKSGRSGRPYIVVFVMGKCIFGWGLGVALWDETWSF